MVKAEDVFNTESLMNYVDKNESVDSMVANIENEENIHRVFLRRVEKDGDDIGIEITFF